LKSSDIKMLNLIE